MVVAGFLLTGSAANANTISLVNAGEIAAGGGSLWQYEYAFSNSYLVTGDSYFTINDFGAATEFVAPGGPGPGWVFQPQAFTGRNDVAPLAPGDHGGVLNVTYLWTGATGAVADSSFLFALLSPNPNLAGVVVSYTTGDQNDDIPSLDSNGVGQLIAPGNVPDGGSTAAFLGSVMLAFGMLRRRFGSR